MENINSILENFILQSKTNNLKVLNYPKIFAGFTTFTAGCKNTRTCELMNGYLSEIIRTIR